MSTPFQGEAVEPPLVSIIMNCFNGEKYLKKSIESIFSQTYQNWELIFWDNLSNDGSAQIINAYQDQRIKYFLSTSHSVLYEARNAAIDKSSGDLIAFLDVDDWWESEKLEAEVNAFNLYPNISAVYTNYWKYYQETGNERVALVKAPSGPRIANDLLGDYVCGMLTLMVKKRDLNFKNSNIFDNRYNLIGDFDMVIRLASEKEFLYLEEPLCHYRIHSENESKRSYQRWAEEFTLWKSENRKKYGNFSNFYRITEIIIFYNAMAAKLEGRTFKSICLALKLPIHKERMKVLIMCFLPSWAIILMRKLKARL